MWPTNNARQTIPMLGLRQMRSSDYVSPPLPLETHMLATGPLRAAQKELNKAFSQNLTGNLVTSAGA